jgi:hypothetical protein
LTEIFLAVTREKSRLMRLGREMARYTAYLNLLQDQKWEDELFTQSRDRERRNGATCSEGLQVCEKEQ